MEVKPDSQSKDHAQDKAAAEGFLDDSVDKDDFLQGLQNANVQHAPDKDFSLSFDKAPEAAPGTGAGTGGIEVSQEKEPEVGHSVQSSSRGNELDRAVVMEDGENDQQKLRVSQMNFVQEMDKDGDPRRESRLTINPKTYTHKQSTLKQKTEEPRTHKAISNTRMEERKGEETVKAEFHGGDTNFHPNAQTQTLLKEGTMDSTSKPPTISASAVGGSTQRSAGVISDEPHGISVECCVGCRLI